MQKTLKHAFLIIAHDNFDNLKRLVTMLDSSNTDMFIHIDKKCKYTPRIVARKSTVHFCPSRIDVRWGDISQIKCELTLMEFALSDKIEYDYYHIISGTHLPVINMQGFNTYFEEKPTAIFQPMETSEHEINIKLRRLNFCTKTFKNPSPLIERCSQLIWRVCNAMQRILQMHLYTDENFIKACQWCSLSCEATRYLIRNREKILTKYRWSFCGDEYFAASELVAKFSEGISFRNDYLYQRFCGPSPVFLDNAEYVNIKGYIWARKFSDKSMQSFM